MKKISTLLALMAGLFAFSLAGCEPRSQAIQAVNGPTQATQADPNTLVCLSGSELENVQPMLAQLQKETGVQVKLVSSGTLASVEKLQGGANGYDCGWFSHNKYLMLDSQVKGLVVASERLMSSPVILGVKAAKAKELKWSADGTTWADVATAANAGKFTFAMTSPASSNTGMSALLGVTAALSGSDSVIDDKSISKVELSGFGKGHMLYADSSGWLATAFIRELANPKGPDGIINYESELLRLNATQNAGLTLIYPKEGIVTADYPLMLFNAAKKAQYDKVIAFFKRDDIQKSLMASTYRRPVSANVLPDPALFGEHLLVEVPFPGKLSTIDNLLVSYLDKQRRPAHVYFVIDTSGSMGANGGIEQLRKSLVGLAGNDQSVTGRFARFRAREKVTFIEFGSGIKVQQSYAVGTDATDRAAVLGKITTYVQGLSPEGGTAIFEAVHAAHEMARANLKTEPGYVQSIVVMTDGQSNEGMREGEFTEYYAGLAGSDKSIRIFGVLFGADASMSQLVGLTHAAGGEVFDGSTSLSAVFKKIRGYQ